MIPEMSARSLARENGLKALWIEDMAAILLLVSVE
jgi:hypothetical protein